VGEGFFCRGFGGGVMKGGGRWIRTVVCRCFIIAVG
jgi:hypothetical protein